ncbi:hypothetical protein, partial [Amphibiibacter pelophylacis]
RSAPSSLSGQNAWDKRSPAGGRSGSNSSRPMFGLTALPPRRSTAAMTGRLDRLLWLLVHDLSLWSALDHGDRALLAQQMAPWPQLFAWLGQQYDELGAISAATLQRHLAHAHWSPAPGHEDSAEALHHSASAIARKVMALLPPNDSSAARIQDVQTTLQQLHLEHLDRRIERLLRQRSEPPSDDGEASSGDSPALREELARCLQRRDALKKRLSPIGREGVPGQPSG